MKKQKQSDIADILIGWYGVHHRDLPWRATTDPYLIWISEVILQQTRVAQGMDYYCRFTARFPDVRSLAEAHEDEVLKYWQGLGYYSRARSLHSAARDVITRFGGVFPTRYEDVLSLKGVGDYTAAAICSFAYGLPHAAVDGNVYRVLARLFAVDMPIDSTQGKKYFAQLAASLLDTERAGLFNQAMMEFGALQCVPKSPDCIACPLSDRCLALVRGTVDKLPVKAGKTEVKPRWFNYLHIRCEGQTLLAQRKGRDIWQNLYEYPLIETTEAVDFAGLERDDRFRHLFEGVEKIEMVRSVRMPAHVLSHRVIHSVFYELRVSGFSPAMDAYIRVTDGEIDRYAISRLIELYRER